MYTHLPLLAEGTANSTFPHTTLNTVKGKNTPVQNHTITQIDITQIGSNPYREQMTVTEKKNQHGRDTKSYTDGRRSPGSLRPSPARFPD